MVKNSHELQRLDIQQSSHSMRAGTGDREKPGATPPSHRISPPFLVNFGECVWQEHGPRSLVATLSAPGFSWSSQKGSQASIGGKGNCLKPISPFPTNAKYIVRAASGAGVVAAQLLVK